MGCEVIGIRRGWEGLTHVNLQDPASRTRYILPLNRENTRTIDRTGGNLAAQLAHQPLQNEEAAAGAGGPGVPHGRIHQRRASPPRRST